MGKNSFGRAPEYNQETSATQGSTKTKDGAQESTGGALPAGKVLL